MDRISKIGADIDINTIKKIKEIKEISPELKVNNQDFQKLVKNHAEIQMTSKEFQYLMKNRPLIKYRPARNSFIKKGDKKILANALNINEDEVDMYLKQVEMLDFNENAVAQLANNKMKQLTQAEIKTAMSYVYRHGTQTQVIRWLNYELSHARNVLQTLYSTMNSDLDGISSYYDRPIHALSNENARKLHDVIKANLKTARENNQISEKDELEAADWSLKRIVEIQNNPDLRQLFKIRSII